MNVLDVATAIVERSPRLTTMQLQKLTYFVQAWHTTIYGEPVFSAEFQAWKDGPVSPDLHDRYRGMKWVGNATFGDSSKLTAQVTGIVDLVIAQYGLLDGDQLSLLTHAETPWLAARDGLNDGEFSQAKIPLESMRAFYVDKDLAGHTAVELAIVGPNPFSREVQEVISRLDGVLSRFRESEYSSEHPEDDREPRFTSGFDLETYLEEAQAPSNAL